MLSPEVQKLYDRLTDKQKRFVDLWTGTATETAKLAGYSRPKVDGDRCLKHVGIGRIISFKRAAEIKPLVMNRIQRQELWTQIALDKSEKVVDRLKASELLGKSEGDFLDRAEITGKYGSPLLNTLRIEYVNPG